MLHWNQTSGTDWLAPTRRRFLQAGFLGLGGLSLAELLRREAAAGVAPKKTAVILFFAHGGPSHLETYDMKPLASSEIRGPFLPISTKVSGIEVCEHLPKHAEVAHRFSLLRSVTHDEADHFAGHRRFLSGYGKLKPGFAYESYYPQVGAVANRLLSQPGTGMPAALAVGGVVANGPDYSAGISEGYWSGQYRVPIVNGGLQNATLSVESQRLTDRLAVRRSFDRLRRDTDARGSMDVLDEWDRQAIEIITSGAAAKAFDLTQEDPAVVARYGEGLGRDALIARRLVEAGVRFVSFNSNGHGPGGKAHNWDDHAVNWDLPSEMLARLPEFDHVLATLINDLFDRGLNERVLLIVTGEFGRTPRLEYRDGRVGRDHWPSAMSILYSGGGLPMGRVIGQTDGIGARPVERPYDPQDFLATIYRFLGIDHTQSILDPFGRPIALATGHPITEMGL